MPEVYKYTFPEQILVDMMNPRRHSAMRPEHVARHSTELLHNAFTMGAYFWCYDLEWDNNWRNDPEQKERLTRFAALRKAWLERWGQGTFTDTVGILECPAGQQIRRFGLDGGMLLACASEQELHGSVTVSWNTGTAPECSVMTLGNPVSRNLECEFLPGSAGGPAVRVHLPPEEACVIVFHG